MVGILGDPLLTLRICLERMREKKSPSENENKNAEFPNQMGLTRKRRFC